MCAQAPLWATLHVSISTSDGCPLCCLIAILSAGNQCAAHCFNGLSNFPVSGKPRYSGFPEKCPSCHKYSQADRSVLPLQPAVIRAASNNCRGRIKQDVLLSLLRKQCLKSSLQGKRRKESNRIKKIQYFFPFFVS